MPGIAQGAGEYFEEETMDPDQKIKVDSMAMEKIRDLSKYIGIIGNKSTPFSEANRVVARALELFADGSVIGVSTLDKKEVKQYEIKTYFERLMALSYDKVKIEWFDIQYISDLEQTPDGKYVGVVTIYQKFEGSQNDALVYKDVTKKDITIYVERKMMQVEGMDIDFWDVLLGDIVVSETML
ncbi:hypothetical protein C900_05587 [Fulvivirga imtechensis AK7]|uniref:Uncharacterized protein n=1 Tax=Fulvivirga imtechensis AK7 TaxID=1237149 RepID=L8JMZ8_9BACT|nr:hypothetical protein [Fulvivirga imtechensis]ELR68894.1 hypothetical protein C900_05587 [Fulvivirga imtechensis AK7]